MELAICNPSSEELSIVIENDIRKSFRGAKVGVNIDKIQELRLARAFNVVDAIDLNHLPACNGENLFGIGNISNQNITNIIRSRLRSNNLS